MEEANEILHSNVNEGKKNKHNSNVQELQDIIKRPNLRIYPIEGGKIQSKDIVNLFNKIIAENFPSIEKEMNI